MCDFQCSATLAAAITYLASNPYVIIRLPLVRMRSRTHPQRFAPSRSQAQWRSVGAITIERTVRGSSTRSAMVWTGRDLDSGGCGDFRRRPADLLLMSWMVPYFLLVSFLLPNSYVTVLRAASGAVLAARMGH